MEKDTMINNLIIRQETKEDYKKTELMIMRSFWNKYWSGCTEHLLTRIIRDSQDYIPEISRIAEIDGQIVGAIYYTKAWIVDGNSRHEIATFGPLAVEPAWEGNDIGGALMRETIKLAQKQGIAGIVIIGEPYYYPRFGFERASKYKITDARGKSFDEIMVLPLNDDFSLIRGKLIESSDFEKLGDEAALFRISEEFPEYRKVKVKEGFMQIFEQHLGVVESIENDIYNVRYWEKLIPAKLAGDINEKPKAGSDVKFKWNHGGESKITMVFKNLLEE